jgi:hypothetical protein
VRKGRGTLDHQLAEKDDCLAIGPRDNALFKSTYRLGQRCRKVMRRSREGNCAFGLRADLRFNSLRGVRLAKIRSGVITGLPLRHL